MEIFGSSSGQYKPLIIDELDCHGNAIENVRAGYLLEDYGHIQDEKINEWAERVQRGGSRKLDTEGLYRETFPNGCGYLSTGTDDGRAGFWRLGKAK